MPIPFLSEIERLINEHGSATILKERLALAADQYSALEKKLADALEREAALMNEVKSLRDELEDASTKLRDDPVKSTSQNAQHLDSTKENILLHLASQDDFDGNIARKLGIGEQVVTFHLEELFDMGFIHRSLSMTGQTFPWRLIKDGRRYLVVNSLIT